MHILKLILLFTPVITFGQNTTPEKEKHSRSESRFEIDNSGFFGKTELDTTYYFDNQIAEISTYAVDRNSKMSGNKFGISTTFFTNGKIKSQGKYEICSTLYRGLTNGIRLEFSYKVDEWIYYYENGQVKAKGKYKVVDSGVDTGIPDQVKKHSIHADNWTYFNADGSIAKDNLKLITEIEHNPNCK
jgi:hypothetical protein